eukprot:TRINITY_DN548_c1_g1_i5.p2 TRINITY_DN548_c1_g1~~TRINITY_DN548_c1_g1_i5.p2  ORF type:complete len:266 (-),score=0.43 TRINITY_DN548_c1_g1_i5:64-861(-)
MKSLYKPQQINHRNSQPHVLQTSQTHYQETHPQYSNLQNFVLHYASIKSKKKALYRLSIGDRIESVSGFVPDEKFFIRCDVRYNVSTMHRILDTNLRTLQQNLCHFTSRCTTIIQLYSQFLYMYYLSSLCSVKLLLSRPVLRIHQRPDEIRYRQPFEHHAPRTVVIQRSPRQINRTRPGQARKRARNSEYRPHRLLPQIRVVRRESARAEPLRKLRQTHEGDRGLKVQIRAVGGDQSEGEEQRGGAEVSDPREDFASSGGCFNSS